MVYLNPGVEPVLPAHREAEIEAMDDDDHIHDALTGSDDDAHSPVGGGKGAAPKSRRTSVEGIDDSVDMGGEDTPNGAVPTKVQRARKGRCAQNSPFPSATPEAGPYIWPDLLAMQRGSGDCRHG